MSFTKSSSKPTLHPPRLRIFRPGGSANASSRALRAAQLFALALCALGVMSLRIDLPFALYFLQERCPKIVREFVELFEAFSHAFGVMMILVTIYWLDPKARAALWRVGCAAIVGGLAANLGKLLVSRVRPKYFDFVGGVETTFGDWLPFLHAGTNGQSFPSAHAATAFAFAAALGWLYPRGRWVFLFMAAMAGLQRVAGYAHFLSDSCWGASVGWCVGSAFLYWPQLAEQFDRLEARLRSNPSEAGSDYVGERLAA